MISKDNDNTKKNKCIMGLLKGTCWFAQSDQTIKGQITGRNKLRSPSPIIFSSCSEMPRVIEKRDFFPELICI